jgi:hypothetical protein
MPMGISTWRQTGTKWCPACKVEKPLKAYTVYKIGKRKGHPAGSCKECRTVLHKTRKRVDPTIYERIEWPCKLKRLYGITVEQYDALLEKQNGACAICGSKSSYSRNYKSISSSRTKFSVDHCHSTGKVRGLLCTKCNRALGMLNDSIEVVLRMAKYLKKHLA